MVSSEAKTQFEELFWLAEQVCLVAEDAKTFQEECSEVGRKVKQLSQMLNTLLCFITSAQVPIYLRPINCILSAVDDNLKLALPIVSNYGRQSLIGRLLRRCNANQFDELFKLLDASVRDMEWLVALYDPQNEAVGPMTNNKSAKFLVWSCIAAALMGRKIEYRLHAANFLALIAQEKDEYKEIIFEEGGIPPLQKLLMDSSSLDAQITVANALCLLANEEKRKEVIMKEMISTILDRLSRKCPERIQIQAADLITGIAEHNPGLKEYYLIRENVIWRLVTLMSPPEESKDDRRAKLSKLELKISCSKALLTLARGSVSNCRTLTETKGMLCLAKMVETEKGELQNNCLMIIKEIASLAEYNKDFRHSTFKTSSKAANAVTNQLLRVITEFDDTELKIPAIMSIGSLARSFSAKHCEVISPLVSQLGNTNHEVALEAATSLRKFVHPENGLSLEHSKSIVESNGIPLLMNLLGADKRLQLHGIALICYLAKHKENSDALIKAGTLTALETTGREAVAEDPELNEAVPEVIKLLRSNCADERHEESNTSSEGSIKQIIIEKSKAAFDFVRCGSSALFERLTGLTQKLVKAQVKLWSTKTRCKQRLLGAGIFRI